MKFEVSIVMPCLNERSSLGWCIESAQRLLNTHQLSGEILVADNGSTDGSPGLAVSLGARVVEVRGRGYGAAMAAGIAAAQGEIVVVGDSDGSYDFEEAGAMIELVRRGSDLVVGDRFAGKIFQGAMPLSHRFGVPALSLVGRLVSGSSVRDFHCGLRAFKREAVIGLGLTTEGMEYASEMLVRAARANLSVAQVPVSLHPDRRGGRPPHLRTWSDGWRHLRFLLSCRR